ncbi:hypothetical protein NEIG_01161 [Nematocida sp. ERTm5]|nr:hypothetical protein NEIG_01161 [Nematocida sp. ERTm5]
MSQWSRRKTGGLPVRNLSLPIFFGGISEENQAAEIKEALNNTRLCSLTKTRTINLSCLAIKNIPIAPLLSVLKEDQLPLNEQVDYETVFSEINIILNLEGNLIEALPLDLFTATHIHAILLRSNKLRTVPSSIGNLVRLHTLTLSNNPIEYLPIEILYLPIMLFTICNKHFLSTEEIDRRNALITFDGTTLNELCLKTVASGDMPNISPSIKKQHFICYGCKLLTTSRNIIFKLIAYKGHTIPFSMRVCSLNCKEKCLYNESDSATA